jgi:hypothetical protein
MVTPPGARLPIGVCATAGAAARAAARYNAAWLIEKNGYLSLLDARAARRDANLWRAS